MEEEADRAADREMTCGQRIGDLGDEFEVGDSQERFGLASQMWCAAVSVPSNIAEGAARYSNAEFLRFLQMARGSLAELDTQLTITQRRKYLTGDALNRVTELMEEVGRTLQGLIARRKQMAEQQERAKGR